MPSLQQLDDDVLIHIYCSLPIVSIVRSRQACKRLATISRLRFVWQTVCINQVLSEGFPFPDRLLASSNASELEQLAIRALRLGAFWLTPSPDSAHEHFLEFQASTGTGVSDLRFLSGHGGRYVVTIYKGIWSTISCWDVGRHFSSSSSSVIPPLKVASWSPAKAIFAGFAVNTDPESDAAIAVAVQCGGDAQTIQILSIVDLDGATPSFQVICNISSTFRPIALKGDLLACSDDASETVVMNWRKNTFALLKGSQRPIDEHFQYNRCLQVIFAFKSMLVVRARSIELFPEPHLCLSGGDYNTYRPIGFHSFGWVDGVAVNTQSGPRVSVQGMLQPPGHDPLSILLRPESDDPWASDVHMLEQFILSPNPALDGLLPPLPQINVSADETASPASTPYLFPPTRADHTSPTVRGFLRCRDIVLGSRGTAVWIQPRAALAHLTAFDVHSSTTQVLDMYNDSDSHPYSNWNLDTYAGHRDRVAYREESLCAAVFAGPMQRRHREMRGESRARILLVQDGYYWTALDYDEEVGRVALGASDGRVTVLDLV